MMPMVSNTRLAGPPGRRSLMLAGAMGAALLLGGCVGHVGRLPSPVHPPPEPPTAIDGYFSMSDGARLPYHLWPAAGWTGAPPHTVILALHGFNDSRDAWEVPAPAFSAAGMAVIAPDLRGFGDAPGRGRWAGSQRMIDDAREMAVQLRARYPEARLVLMGESMGGAILLALGGQPNPPPVDAYVLLAPAVWGRAEMNVFLRSSLWLASTLAPGYALTAANSPVKVLATDNRAALIRLSTDRLTLGSTRFDTLRGLVNLMDDALAAAPHFHPGVPALFLYGGKDQLVPPRATAATWRLLPPGQTEAFYPDGYHLLPRDLDRAQPIGDIIAWLAAPQAPLPSGAASRATAWLAKQP